MASPRPEARARERFRISGKRKSPRSRYGFKYNTKTPQGLKTLLADIAREVRECSVRESKASREAVFAALDKGHKLRTAHKWLAFWKTRARKKRWEETPPTWEEWLKVNFDGCRRTAEFYKDLAKHEKLPEVQAELKAPDVSIRKLIQVVRSLRLDEDKKEKGGEEKPSGGLNGKADAKPKLTEHQCNLMEMRKRFAEIAKKWDEDTVAFLAFSHKFDDCLEALNAEVEPVASLLMEANAKHYEWVRRNDRRPPSRSRRGARRQWEARADERAKEQEVVRKEQKAFALKVWKQYRDRDDLTPWQREQIAGVLEPYAELLSPDFQEKLTHFARGGPPLRCGGGGVQPANGQETTNGRECEKNGFLAHLDEEE